MTTHESDLYCIKDLVGQKENWHFHVPIYQRLYVWKDEQIKTLINDVLNAWETTKNEKDPRQFFLGGTIVKECTASSADETERHFELIDGQQRFTTLCLLCHAWKGDLLPFLFVEDKDRKRPRLSFAIRPHANDFLEGLLREETELQEHTDPGLVRMRQAIDIMHAEIGNRDLVDKIHEVAKFVYEQVKFVVTRVPAQTDLNKLFEVINNRGVQLQHHEILKARMLEKLDEVDRLRHANLWDACADMDEFVEKSLAGISGRYLYEFTSLLTGNPRTSKDAVLDLLGKDEKGESGLGTQTLEAILNASYQPAVKARSEDPDEREPGWSRSIVGFPLFLQHVLRLWLLKEGREDLERIADKELLASFDRHFFQTPGIKTENVKSFVSLLWQVRVLWDRHVIRWVKRDGEEIHQVCKVSIETGEKVGQQYLRRSAESALEPGFALLQSMLYHSQENTTHYWLTPFLHKLCSLAEFEQEAAAKQAFTYLRQLDNQMFGTVLENSLIERSSNACKALPDPTSSTSSIHQIALRQPDGVRFKHYWFYKLEFVLWYLWNTGAGFDDRKERWKDFRITSRSSIEHVQPQSPKEHDSNQIEILDSFGNLALVSRNLNSELSNKSFVEKKAYFEARKSQRIDSLKLDLIYANNVWNDSAVECHLAEILAAMDEYYLLNGMQNALSDL